MCKRIKSCHIIKIKVLAWSLPFGRAPKKCCQLSMLKRGNSSAFVFVPQRAAQEPLLAPSPPTPPPAGQLPPLCPPLPRPSPHRLAHPAPAPISPFFKTNAKVRRSGRGKQGTRDANANASSEPHARSPGCAADFPFP